MSVLLMKCPIHEEVLTQYLCTDVICFSIRFNACLTEKVPYMSHDGKFQMTGLR